MPATPDDHWWFKLTAPVRLALEGRVGWECGAMLAARPLLDLAPRGDGHPVLVFPQMFGGDLTTQPLRAYLQGLGYRAEPWRLGVNPGPSDQLLEACQARLQELHREHRRRVSLVGWSLGGLYAREIAKASPAAVRLVITLGTPFTGKPSPAEIWQMSARLTGEPMGLTERHGPFERTPPVPTTSIYSRSDGIVPWRCSVERPGPTTENIEIESSHLGLAVNPLVLYAIADRLAQPEGGWRPFDRRGPRGWFYADPER